jgi:hypothetical protein
MDSMTSIVVTLQVTGFHCWPAAPLVYGYLRDRHRHTFHIRAEKCVSHSDRNIEFNDFKERLRLWLLARFGDPCEFSSRSCEELALLLCKEFDLCACEVFEDGENGARVVCSIVNKEV